MEDVCTVVLDDNTTYHLSAREWNQVVQTGLRERGYLGKKKSGCDHGKTLRMRTGGL